MVTKRSTDKGLWFQTVFVTKSPCPKVLSLRLEIVFLREMNDGQLRIVIFAFYKAGNQ
jgi:hypothetical protein